MSAERAKRTRRQFCSQTERVHSKRMSLQEKHDGEGRESEIDDNTDTAYPLKRLNGSSSAVLMADSGDRDGQKDIRLMIENVLTQLKQQGAQLLELSKQITDLTEQLSKHPSPISCLPSSQQPTLSTSPICTETINGEKLLHIGNLRKTGTPPISKSTPPHSTYSKSDEPPSGCSNLLPPVASIPLPISKDQSKQEARPGNHFPVKTDNSTPLFRSPFRRNPPQQQHPSTHHPTFLSQAATIPQRECPAVQPSPFRFSATMHSSSNSDTSCRVERSVKNQYLVSNKDIATSSCALEAIKSAALHCVSMKAIGDTKQHCQGERESRISLDHSKTNTEEKDESTNKLSACSQSYRLPASFEKPPLQCRETGAINSSTPQPEELALLQESVDSFIRNNAYCRQSDALLDLLMEVLKRSGHQALPEDKSLSDVQQQSSSSSPGISTASSTPISNEPLEEVDSGTEKAGDGGSLAGPHNDNPSSLLSDCLKRLPTDRSDTSKAARPLAYSDVWRSCWVDGKE